MWRVGHRWLPLNAESRGCPLRLRRGGRRLLFAGRVECVSEQVGLRLLHLITNLSYLPRLPRRRRDLERDRMALEEQAIQLLNGSLRVVFPNVRDVTEPIACRPEIRPLA